MWVKRSVSEQTGSAFKYLVKVGHPEDQWTVRFGSRPRSDDAGCTLQDERSPVHELVWQSLTKRAMLETLSRFGIDVSLQDRFIIRHSYVQQSSLGLDGLMTYSQTTDSC